MRNADLLPAAVLKRKAVVYVRQSTQAQVQTNLESQRRQYELVDEARRHGFQSVEVIDDDLGRSASGMTARPGFERLVAWLCAGGFLGKRRIGRLRDLIELAPRMRPARSKDDIALDGQPLEAGVAVDVENALEVLKMRHRALGLSVRREQIDSRRRLRSRPWSLLACIDPQASGLRASTARIEHRDGRVISKEMIGGKDVLAQPTVQSFEPPAGAADPARECRAFDLDAMPGKDPNDLGARMNVLSTERKTLSAEFEAEPPPVNVLALHPAVLERYAEQLGKLQDALAKGINAGDSDGAEAMRDLVETVTVFRDTSRPGGVEVEIAGRLTALLGAPAYPNGVKGAWGKVVAEVRYRQSPRRDFPSFTVDLSAGVG